MTLHPITMLRADIWFHAKLMPLVLKFQSFSTMLNNADVANVDRYQGVPTEAISKLVIRSTHHPWFMRNRRCLRQGLIGYQFMRKAGYRPELHFGVEVESLDAPNINAHCWVVLDGKPVLNDILAGMETIFIHSLEKK
ncbi:MAG: lasso peptide biosynthesis B2 protein [Rhizobiaceae bacterium]